LQLRPILWCWLSPALRSGLLVFGTWKVPPSAPSKPFRTYAELVSILSDRGMQIDDAEHAKRKLAQLGYYRLSGFWYSARQFQVNEQRQKQFCAITKKPLRLEIFQVNTTFDDAVALYHFDKSLRMLMLDAIECLEVNLKTVVAHEIGYHDPMAYEKSNFILDKWARPYIDRHGKPRNKWLEWSKKQQSHIVRSQEDCIRWHIRTQKCIPI
jgi:abortive infection bacteriophage resistance protein